MFRRHDELGEHAPDGFLARPAEHALGAAVPLEDHAALVDGDDRVVRRVEEQAKRRGGVRLFGREQVVEGHGSGHLKE